MKVNAPLSLDIAFMLQLKIVLGSLMEFFFLVVIFVFFLFCNKRTVTGKLNSCLEAPKKKKHYVLYVKVYVNVLKL